MVPLSRPEALPQTAAGPGRTGSPWRERIFVTQCLARLRQTGLASPVVLPDATDLDWQTVCAETARHGVGPLLRQALGECPTSCPPAAWHELLDQARCTAGLNALAFALLDQLLAAFRRSDLAPPILLKGASLVHTVYGRIGLRPMQDLDILVDRSEQHAAAALIEDLGYYQVRPVSPSRWHAAIVEATETRLAFARGGKQPGLPLECHLALQEWPEADLAGLRARSRAVGSQSVPGRVLDPVDETLLLLLHLERHQRPEVGGGGRLLWCFDVAARLQGMGGRWDELGALLEALPPSRRAQVREALAFACELFAVAVPPALAPPLDAAARARQSRRLWAPSRKPLPDLPWMAGVLRNSPRLVSPLAKARFVGGYVLPPPSYVREQYGLTRPLQQALWYAARPLDLAGKVARILLRR